MFSSSAKISLFIFYQYFQFYFSPFLIGYMILLFLFNTELFFLTTSNGSTQIPPSVGTVLAAHLYALPCIAYYNNYLLTMFCEMQPVCAWFQLIFQLIVCTDESSWLPYDMVCTSGSNWLSLKFVNIYNQIDFWMQHVYEGIKLTVKCNVCM